MSTAPKDAEAKGDAEVVHEQPPSSGCSCRTTGSSLTTKTNGSGGLLGGLLLGLSILGRKRRRISR